MIEGDPTTTATEPLRGYAYQIWQTVFAWLRLRASDDLFLEVVEDFAVAQNAQLIAVQVKDRRKKLTLRSRQAVDALGRFLVLRERNPGRQVLYRFLTTAVPAQERGRPFGTTRKGIFEWERCQKSHDLTLARTIASVLIGAPRIPQSLAQFLRSASPNEVFETLILPVTWESGSPRMLSVEDAVGELLITLGEQKGVPPSESVKVVGTLLRRVLSTATRPDPLARRLTRAHLLEVFEEATTERVASGEIRSLRRVASSLSDSLLTMLGTAGGPLPSLIPAAATHQVSQQPPRLAATTVPRSALLEKARVALSQKGLLFLTGSVGVGKTILASDLASNVGRSVAWVPCQRRPFLLHRLLSSLDFPTPHGLWVLDDLDLTSTTLEPSFTTLVYALRERGDYLLVTTQTPPTAKDLRGLGVDEGTILPIGMLSEGEVAALSGSLGCPDSLIAGWTQVALSHTSGHAQLTHALLLDLKSKGWPAPIPGYGSQAPPSVTRERHEMQEVLLRSVADNAAIFLCRLSAYPGWFRREHALAIGADSGLVGPLPGRVFDSLVGPYLEDVGAGYYRLSPLLHDVAEHTWGLEQLRHVRGEVARAALSASARLTILDASALLIAGILASLDDVLTTICSGLLREWSTGKEGIVEHLSWLVGVNLQSKIKSPRVRYLFYWLEFRIASATGSHACPMILEAWDRSAHDLTETDEAAVGALGVGIHAIISMSAVLPLGLVLEYLISIAALCDASPAAARKWKSMASSVWPDYQPDQYLGLQFLMVAYRCKNAADVETLILGLDALAPDRRLQFLSCCFGQGRERALFVDRAWTAELDRSEPDWEGAIRALRRAADAGKRWGAISIYSTAAAGIAAVYGEHLGASSRAEQELDAAEADLGSLPILVEQRANVRFANGDNAGSLELLRSLLRDWSPPPVASASVGAGSVSHAFGHRKAAIAAAHLGFWSEAANWLTDGARVAESCLDRTFVSGFKADAGFCYWRAGANDDAIAILRDSIVHLEQAGEPSSDTKARIAGKLVGYLVLWLSRAVAAETPDIFSPPVIGMCSNPEKSPGLETLPVTPLDFTWLHLCQTEERLRGTYEVFNAVEDRVLGSPFGSVRLFGTELDIGRSIRLSRYDGLGRRAQDHANEVDLNFQARPMGHEIGMPLPPATNDVANFALGSSIFSAALLSLWERGEAALALTTWGREAPSLGFALEFSDWLRKARGLVTSEAAAARKILRGESDGDAQILAAIRLATDPIVSPPWLFLSQASLLDFFSQGPWGRAVGPSLVAVFERQWLRAVRTPALLRIPRISVPAIRKACSSNEDPLAKAAKIIIAAELAVDVRVPGTVRNRLAALAGGHAGSFET